MDEAVLRIIMEGGGGLDGPSQGPSSRKRTTHFANDTTVIPPETYGPPSPRPRLKTPTPPSSGNGFDPVEEAKKRFELEKRRQLVDIEYSRLIPPPLPVLPFDPADEARKRLEQDKKRADVDAEYAKLVPPPPAKTPADIAKDWLKRDQERAAIEAEYLKLAPPPPFDPIEGAKKRLEAEQKRAAIDAEYLKLAPAVMAIPVPPPSATPFDPKEEARRQYNMQQNAAKVKSAYDEMYGKDEVESSKFLGIARHFSRSIGGGVGRTVGAALNMGQGASSAAAGVAGAAGGAAFVIGAAVAAISAATVAINSATNSMSSRYGEYSPEIASAQAYAEIRQTIGDMRRSQEAAPELSKYIQVQSDIQQKYEDFKIRLLTQILERVTPILELLEKIMPEGKNIADGIIALLDPLAGINMIAKGMLDHQRDASLPDTADPTDTLRMFAAGQRELPIPGER